MDLEEVSVGRCIVELMSYQLILTSNGIGNSLYKLQYDDNHRFIFSITNKLDVLYCYLVHKMKFIMVL